MKTQDYFCGNGKQTTEAQLALNPENSFKSVEMLKPVCFSFLFL